MDSLPPSLDFEVLDSLSEGDPTAEQEILGLFLDNATTLMTSLKGSLATCNQQEARQQIHQLKGACGSVGALRLEFYIQQLGHSNKQGEWETVPELLALIEKELKTVRTYLSTYG